MLRKGFSHYPCLRKISHIVEEGAQTKLFGNKADQAPSPLPPCCRFIEQTEYDDMDSLKIDYRIASCLHYDGERLSTT